MCIKLITELGVEKQSENSFSKKHLVSGAVNILSVGAFFTTNWSCKCYTS